MKVCLEIDNFLLLGFFVLLPEKVLLVMDSLRFFEAFLVLPDWFLRDRLLLAIMRPLKASSLFRSKSSPE